MPTDTISKNLNSLLVAIILIYIVWLAVGQTRNEREIAVMKNDIAELKLKTDEIVPRSENERRFTNAERGFEQNAERIGKVEQYLLHKK